MARFNLQRTRYVEGFLVGVISLLVGALATASAHAGAITVDGSIFADDFNGTTLDTVKWSGAGGYINSPSTRSFDGASLTCYSTPVSYNCIDSATLAFGSTWAEQIRFNVSGTLSSSNSLKQYSLLETWDSAYTGRVGVLLRAGQDGTGADGATYSLTWGTGGTDVLATLSKGQFYTITANRKNDGNVDIYVDDTLTATRAVIGGTPAILRLGDGYTGADGAGGTVSFDYVKVGTFSMVPEPSSMTLLVSAGLGLLVCAWRRRT